MTYLATKHKISRQYCTQEWDDNLIFKKCHLFSLFITKRTKLFGEIVALRESLHWHGTSKIYTLIFFLFSSIWMDSLVFYLGISSGWFGFILVFESTSVLIHGHKDFVEFLTVFFFRPISQVNRTAWEKAILVVRLLRHFRLLWFLPNWPVLTTEPTN